MKKIFILLLFSAGILSAQDSTKSLVYKDNRPPSNPILIAPNYPSYPLVAGYLLVKAANEGDPFAEHELGLRYLLGQGFPADTTKAAFWIKKAADKNLPQAKFNYGIMLSNGIGVDWDPFEAYECFTTAANKGMAESQYAVGIFYTDNMVVNRNYNEAYKWIKLAAEGDLEYAKETLKKLEESGLVTELGTIGDSLEIVNDPIADLEESSLMNQNWELDFVNFDDDSLSEQDEVESIKQLLTKNKTELSDILGLDKKSAQDSSKDTSAVGLIKLAAQNGSPEALFIAGRSFHKGIATEKDLVKAVVYFIRAYRLGSYKASEALFSISRSQQLYNELKDRIDNHTDPDAMFAWAGLVAMGMDFQLTSDQALDLLEDAVELDHIPSIIEMGLAYYSGSLVDKDKEEAIDYWERAAELGSQEAKIRIAFTKVLDDDEDISSEIELLLSTADEGSVLAQTALGYCYEKGKGVKQHKAKAVDYYRKAAQRGNRTSFDSLKKLYDEIRPDDAVYQIYGD